MGEGRGGRLQGKVAIVTGAGSSGPGWGNGKATAVLFAREGARVLCVDRVAAAAEETAGLIAAEGGTALAHVADVADEAQVAATVAAAAARWGRLDVLHNNVGIGWPAGLLDLSLADWNRVMTVNVTSMFLMCKHAVPALLQAGGGAIVNVSSLSGLRALRPETAYATSKAAVNALTQNVAMEFAARKLRCNAIVPGLMDTPLVRVSLGAGKSPAEVEALVAARHALSPTGRMGDGWDVAKLAVFLASDEAAYINGQCLSVDGGLGNLVGR